jgi:hypothetical protein
MALPFPVGDRADEVFSRAMRRVDATGAPHEHADAPGEIAAPLRWLVTFTLPEKRFRMSLTFCPTLERTTRTATRAKLLLGAFRTRDDRY